MLHSGCHLLHLLVNLISCLSNFNKSIIHKIIFIFADFYGNIFSHGFATYYIQVDIINLQNKYYLNKMASLLSQCMINVIKTHSVQ